MPISPAMIAQAMGGNQQQAPALNVAQDTSVSPQAEINNPTASGTQSPASSAPVVQDMGAQSPQGGPQDSMQSLNPHGGQADWTQSPQGVMGKIQEHMATLNNSQKQFVASQLTPETVALIQLVTGSPEMGQYFSKFANPDKVLVPMDRKSVGQLNAGPAGAKPGTPPTSGGPIPEPAAETQPQQPTPATS